MKALENVGCGDPSGGAASGLPGRSGLEGSARASGGKDAIVPRPRDISEAEECFIRAHVLERREPGGGRWPFAGDGPWHLIQPEVGDIAGEFSETLIENQAGKLLQVRKIDSLEPRAPLDAAEVAELAVLRSWLALVPERDRKLVWIATARLAAGEGRVPWKAIGRWLRIDRSPDTVARRYRQAMARAVCALQGWPSRRAMQMAR